MQIFAESCPWESRIGRPTLTPFHDIKKQILVKYGKTKWVSHATEDFFVAALNGRMRQRREKTLVGHERQRKNS